MKLTLNIGLLVSVDAPAGITGKPNMELDPDHAYRVALAILGPLPCTEVTSQVQVSETERTLVIQLRSNALPGHEATVALWDQAVHFADSPSTPLYRLSEALGQDCIAIAWDSRALGTDGALVGPRAAAWGEFNPQYFLPLKG